MGHRRQGRRGCRCISCWGASCAIRIRAYNGGIRFPMSAAGPEDFRREHGEDEASPERFSIIKASIAFHSATLYNVPGLTLRAMCAKGPPHPIAAR